MPWSLVWKLQIVPFFSFCLVFIWLSIKARQMALFQSSSSVSWKSPSIKLAEKAQLILALYIFSGNKKNVEQEIVTVCFFSLFLKHSTVQTFWTLIKLIVLPFFFFFVEVSVVQKSKWVHFNNTVQSAYNFWKIFGYFILSVRLVCYSFIIYKHSNAA